MDAAREREWNELLAELLRHANCQIRRRHAHGLDAEDVAQEAGTRLLQRWQGVLPPVGHPERSAPWLAGVARNVARELFRAQRRVHPSPSLLHEIGELGACEQPWSPLQEDEAFDLPEMLRARIVDDPSPDAKLLGMLIDHQPLSEILFLAGASAQSLARRLRHVALRLQSADDDEDGSLAAAGSHAAPAPDLDGNANWSTVLELRDGGLSWSETARAMGSTVGAVRQLHRRATRARLKLDLRQSSVHTGVAAAAS